MPEEVEQDTFTLYFPVDDTTESFETLEEFQSAIALIGSEWLFLVNGKTQSGVERDRQSVIEIQLKDLANSLNRMMAGIRNVSISFNEFISMGGSLQRDYAEVQKRIRDLHDNTSQFYLYSPSSARKKYLLDMSQKSTNFGAMAYEYMISEQLDPSKGTTHAFVLSDVRRFLAEIAPFETKLSIIRDQFFDEFSSKKDDVIADFTRQFERLESAYKASKELTEPIEYWETKRRRHRRTAFVFLVFLGGVGFAIYCLWEMAFEMLTKNTSVAVAATETSEAVARVDPPLWLLGLVASISLVIIWIIKILVRLLLSNIHLAEDADERIVLINTYITMLRMDGVSAGSAKEKLYDSIFRTASTGLIHGDGMPNLLHTKVINKVIDDS